MHTACTMNVSLPDDLTTTSQAPSSPRTMRPEGMIRDSGARLPKPPLIGTSPDTASHSASDTGVSRNAVIIGPSQSPRSTSVA